MHYLLKITEKPRLQEDINNTRTKISQLLIQSSDNIKSVNFSSISNNDLRLLFDLYDLLFFDNWFKDNYKGQILFSLSKRMSRSAGLTICPRNISKIKQENVIIEIRIGINLIFNYHSTERMKMVSGITSSSSLEALQLVFEHEICHLVEFLLYKKSSCKNKRFKNIAHNLFGHTDSYHKLPTNTEIAVEQLGFKLGDEVSFNYKGKEKRGILYNIRKRAIIFVMDKNGVYSDKNGMRYTKYYVPLKSLKESEE